MLLFLVPIYIKLLSYLIPLSSKSCITQHWYRSFCQVFCCLGSLKMFDIINDMLQSKWSFLSLPAMPEDTEPAWTQMSTLYLDIFTNVLFQQLFIVGLVIFYLLDILGCYIYDKYVPKDGKK